MFGIILEVFAAIISTAIVVVSVGIFGLLCLGVILDYRNNKY